MMFLGKSDYRARGPGAQQYSSVPSRQIHANAIGSPAMSYGHVELFRCPVRLRRLVQRVQ